MILTFFLGFSLMFISEYLKRRERDSNPRNGQAVHRISSPAQSVTLASLLVARTAYKGTKENRKRFFADSRSSQCRFQYQIQQRDKSNDRTPSCDFADVRSSPNP